MANEKMGPQKGPKRVGFIKKRMDRGGYKVVATTLVVLLYFGLSTLLFEMDYRAVFNGSQLAGVTLGVLLLTASQYRRGMGRPRLLLYAKQNALLAGAITAIFAAMSSFKPQSLLPLLYGCLWYAVLGIQAKGEDGAKDNEEAKANQGVSLEDSAMTLDALQYLNLSPEVAYPILTAKGFTPREIHVALKLLANVSNKEIGEVLFISEATVKKHIQNMFRKCGAKDRQDFLQLYISWLQ